MLYILNKDRKPVPEPDLHKWAEWFEQAELRTVAREDVCGYSVSTVFLGMAHPGMHGLNMLWETMVFGDGPMDHYQHRCSGSWEQAEAMHASIVRLVQTAVTTETHKKFYEDKRRTNRRRPT